MFQSSKMSVKVLSLQEWSTKWSTTRTPYITELIWWCVLQKLFWSIVSFRKAFAESKKERNHNIQGGTVKMSNRLASMSTFLSTYLLGLLCLCGSQTILQMRPKLLQNDCGRPSLYWSLSGDILNSIPYLTLGMPFNLNMVGQWVNCLLYWGNTPKHGSSRLAQEQLHIIGGSGIWNEVFRYCLG